MYTKILFASLSTFLASNVVFANNFYIGADIGAIALQNKLSLLEGVFDGGAFGFVGGGFGGYTYNVTNQWNLGLEGFIDGTAVTINDVVHAGPTVASTTIKDRYNGGVRLLPGYQFLKRVEGHVLVGYVRGNFNFSDTDHHLNTNFAANGFQFGLGSSIGVFDNFSVRGDMIYNGYQSHTILASSGDAHKSQPSSLAGTVSAVYSFD